MSAGTDDERPHEIVIIKRVVDDEGEGHHGGAWKVAFADFMTAMMAFFLVLWIVNSTTREVKTSLARYFNPIKLTESATAKRGVTDSREDAEEVQGDRKDKQGPAEKAKESKSEPHASRPDAKPGDTPPAAGGGVSALPIPAPTAAPAPAPISAPAPGATPLETRMSAADPARAAAQAGEALTPAPKNKGDGPAHDAFRDPFERRALQESRAGAQEAAREDMNAKLKESLSQALGSDEAAKIGAHIEVKSDPEGVLISLNDGMDFAMFPVGGAEADLRLTKILGAIARTLKTTQGGVIVRGHTDARPWRRDGYDNWQLSSARAQAAFRTLIRSGLEEKRVERIEGYADHKLRKPKDPEAPENRRIEILLRKEG